MPANLTPEYKAAEATYRQAREDIVHALKYARVWGSSGFDGQHVGRDHAVRDGDLIESHT